MNFTWPDAMRVEKCKVLSFKKHMEVLLMNIKQFKDEYTKVEVPQEINIFQYGMATVVVILTIICVVVIIRKFMLRTQKSKQCNETEMKNTEELSLEELATLAV